VSSRKSSSFSSNRRVGLLEALEQRTLMSASFLVPAVHPGTIDAAGDLNGDGKADLISVANTVRATDGRGGVKFAPEAALQVQLGNGDGSFGDGSVRVLLPAVQVSNVATGDFDGDGSVDVALVEGPDSAMPGAVHLLLGNGDGTLQPRRDSAVEGWAPRSIAPGDFNRDGKLDLARGGLQWRRAGGSGDPAARHHRGADRAVARAGLCQAADDGAALCGAARP
jgi:hypothetical protein